MPTSQPDHQHPFPSSGEYSSDQNILTFTSLAAPVMSGSYDAPDAAGNSHLILDLGTGDGAIARSLIQDGSQNVRVVSVDTSTHRTRHAREITEGKLPSDELERITFVTDDIRDLVHNNFGIPHQWRASGVSGVITRGFMHTLPLILQKQFLKDIYNVLNPDSQIIMWADTLTDSFAASDADTALRRCSQPQDFLSLSIADDASGAPLFVRAWMYLKNIFDPHSLASLKHYYSSLAEIRSMLSQAGFIGVQVPHEGTSRVNPLKARFGGFRPASQAVKDLEAFSQQFLFDEEGLHTVLGRSLNTKTLPIKTDESEPTYVTEFDMSYHIVMGHKA